MLFQIEHITRYKYSKKVFLEPHIIKLRPRSDSSQSVKSFEVEVVPEPTGATNIIDVDGDSISMWFEELTDSLTIITRSSVETLRVNPFDYILPERAQNLPIQYIAEYESVLSPYRVTSLNHGDKFEEFVAEILLESDTSTQNFLSILTSYIYNNLEHEIRIDGPAHEPDETLSQMKGSCRDFVVLFLEACRSMGIASRFVSGYTYAGVDNVDNDLHAWAEVYLPGAGWRGYDPTLGLAVADQHVALTSGASPIQASPVAGTFRGTGAEVIMGYEISITS